MSTKETYKDGDPCPQCDLGEELALLCKDPEYDTVCGVCGWKMRKQIDVVGDVMALEEGQLSAENTLRLFAYLIRTGQAWQLQGSYGRCATAFIDDHYISREGAILNEPKEGD